MVEIAQRLTMEWVAQRPKSLFESLDIEVGNRDLAETRRVIADVHFFFGCFSFFSAFPARTFISSSMFIRMFFSISTFSLSLNDLTFIFLAPGDREDWAD